MFLIGNIVPQRSSVVKAVGVLTLGYLVYRGAVRFARNDITVYVTELVHLPPFINPVQFANTSLSIEGKVEVETRLIARCQFHLKLAALLRDKSLSSPNTEKVSTSTDANQLSVSSRNKAMTGAYDSTSYSKDSNSFTVTEREYNTTNEVNQMFAQFTPIRKRRVHSAWSSFFFDKNSSVAGSSEGSDWMSSLQQTFHGNTSNPFIYSNSLGNRGSNSNNANDDDETNRKMKNSQKKKTRRNAKYAATQVEQTSPSYYNEQQYPQQHEYQENKWEEEQYSPDGGSNNTATRRAALPLLDVNSIHTMIDRANLWLHENKNTFISFSPACVMSSMLFRYNCQNYTAKSLLETLNHKPYIDMNSTARQLPLQVTDCYVERDSSCVQQSRCFRISFMVHVNPNFNLHDLKIIVTLPSKQCKVVRVSTSGVGEFVHPVGNHTEICAWDVGNITNTTWKQLLHSTCPELPVEKGKKKNEQQQQEDNDQQEKQNKDEIANVHSWHLEEEEESLQNSNSNVKDKDGKKSNSIKINKDLESMNVSESAVRAVNSDLCAVPFSLVYEMPELSGTTVSLPSSEMPWSYSIRENTRNESDSKSDPSSSSSSSNSNNSDNYVINASTSRSPSQRVGQVNNNNNINNFLEEEMAWQTPMSIERDSISRQGDSSTKRMNMSNKDSSSSSSTCLPQNSQIINFIKDEEEELGEHGSKSRQSRTHKHHSSSHRKTHQSKSKNKKAHKDSKSNELQHSMSNKARKRASRALRKQEQREQLMNIAHGLNISSLSEQGKIIPKVELTYRLSSLASGAVVRKLQIVEQEDNWRPRTLLDHIALKRMISTIRKSPKSKVNRFAHYSTWVVQPVVVRVL